MILITIWVYYFFRDPERYSINDDNYLVSPADGLVTDISEKSGPEELRLENITYTRVSVFMKRAIAFGCSLPTPACRPSTSAGRNSAALIFSARSSASTVV